MRRDGSGQHRGWFGFAEPGQHRGGALERDAEPQPVAVGVLLHRRFLQHGQRSGQVAVPGPDGGSQRQGEAENGVEGSGAGQGQAVLDERQRGLWFAEPDRVCGRVAGGRRQRRVPDPSGYLDRLHRGPPRRRVVSGGGPGHRFHGQEEPDEDLDAPFGGLLAAFPGDARPRVLAARSASRSGRAAHRSIPRLTGSLDAGSRRASSARRCASGRSPAKNALHAAAARTGARNSGGHASSWATQASAQTPTVTGDDAAKSARAATIRKASGRAWPPLVRAQVTAACRLSRSARIRRCQSSCAGPSSSGPARSANAA